MGEYTIMHHKSDGAKKADKQKADEIRNSIYKRIMSEKSNVVSPMDKQLERFKKTLKK